MYYQVKAECDNLPRKDGSILVKNELYTERELKRYEIPAQCVVKVSVKKSEIYWLFGARFGSDGYNGKEK